MCTQNISVSNCTYIIGHYQPFSQDYGLVFHIIHIVCVNFIHDFIFFEKLFHGRFFQSQSFWHKSAETKSSMKYILDVNNNNCFVCYFSVHTLCINDNNYQTIVRKIDRQRNAPHHVFIQDSHACFALKYFFFHISF